MSKPLKGFITYSHENTAQKDELRKRLAVMEQRNELVTWDDGQLTPGDGALQEDILKKVEDSDLLLYLVSAASLASKNCNKELAEALKQEIRVIPIILEHCDWLYHQLSNFEVLPDKGKPITKWEDESEGWQNVVDGIRNTVDEMQTQAKSSSENVQNKRLTEWVFQQGNFLLILNQISMAIEAYSHVIDLNPDNADAYINRGAAYIKEDKHDLAIKNCNKAIQLRPDYALTYNNRGVAYDGKGEHDVAISDYDKAIELKPNYADAYNNRGNAYKTKRMYDVAISDYDKAIELKPNYADAYYNRGNAYKVKDEHSLAIKNYNKTIQINSKHAGAYNNRGSIHSEKGDYDRAIEDYIKAIELNPNSAEIYHNRGMAYARRGDYDLAIKDSTKAIELKLDFVDAYHNRGIAYSKKGNYKHAIKDYNKAIGLNPNSDITYYNRGNVYDDIGDCDRAIKDYTKAIELKPDLASAYINRGNVYSNISDYDRAIKDYTKAIELKPDLASAYNNRGVAYGKKDKIDLAIKDYTKAIELNPNRDVTYYNRGVVRLHLQEWEKAKTDLIAAKKKGMDIIAAFRDGYKNVEAYERQHRVKLPKGISLLLTQRRRTRYPKTRKILDADGNPIESPNVVNLRSQLRDAGTPLSEYVKSKPAFGINTAPTEAFVVDKTTRDKFIAAHPSSADILKPFLHGQDLRRWQVDTPQQWLIFTHRGIAINDYPAILKHLEKYQEILSKRKGKQEWYELPVSLNNTERFAQPKLVCPDTYNHQTFAIDTAGYYYGKTAYLIPTEEMWLCGLLNSRTVEWFYSQVSNQLTIDPLRARSGYIQQIPIPDITPVHKALIAKIVDYLIYLQQQPEINSKDLKYARDRIMLGYFERVIDGLVYEAYLPAELHKSDKVFLQPLLDEGLPSIEEIQGDKMSAFRDIFELLYDRMHLVRRHLYYFDSIKPVRIIQGKL
ncbi:MAG: tetratricopeptide repeat protein [Candidatus Poribacteria bacterium]|nr:tetratricopeptide repeat protein [Candidatus Poribacteria bacterium]